MYRSSASDFRAKARAALKGNWATALAVSLVAGLLGAGGTSGGGSVGNSANYVGGNLASSPEFGNFLESISSPVGRVLAAAILGGAIVMVFYALVCFFLGPVIDVGQKKYYITLASGGQANFKQLFGSMDLFGKALGMNIVKALILVACALPGILLYAIVMAAFFTALPGTNNDAALMFLPLLSVLALLLCLAPLIIFSYAYSMASYVLADNPQLGPVAALKKSYVMMRGNKWRLFCLEISFIGWAFLAVLTCGIGVLWLNPYTSAAQSAFYLEISGRAEELENARMQEASQDGGAAEDPEPAAQNCDAQPEQQAQEAAGPWDQKEENH